MKNKLKRLILNLFFHTGLCFFSLGAVIVGAILMIPAALIIPKRIVLRRLRRAISWYGKIIVYVLPSLFVKIEYKDFWEKEESGPFIFICNHRSASDPFLFAFLPYECIQIVNIWPFKLPFFGFFAKLAGYLSVKEMPFDEFSHKMTKLLDEKVNVIAFPEGTRSTSKKLGQFYSSVFRVAMKAKCSIVPVCFTGNETIPPKGSALLNPGTVKIHKLPPLPWEEYKNLTPFALKNRVRDIIAKETARMDAA